MKVFLLYYDTDFGSREEWNTFYTPVEAFGTAEMRQTRIDFIKQQVNEDGEPVENEFHEVDVDIMTFDQLQEWQN